MSVQTESQGLKAWLNADVPASRFHAKTIQFYLGWLKLVSNPLASAVIVVNRLPILVAMFVSVSLIRLCK